MEARKRRSRPRQADVQVKPLKSSGGDSSSDIKPYKMSCKKQCALTTGVIAFVFGCMVFFMPSHIDPVVVELTPPPALRGALEVNSKLTNAKRMYEGQLRGGESVVIFNGSLYTGVHDGRILKITEDKITTFAKFGPVNCTSVPQCGRPLGMRLDRQSQNLLVVDAYLGLFSVSLSNGEIRKLFPKDDSFKVTFFDDLDILPNNQIVVSEASTKFPYHHFMLDALESGANGRLLLIDPTTGSHRVLVDRLFFPNGVQLHSDGRSILVAETTRIRLLRVHLTPDWSGLSQAVDVFTDALPGIPDNLRPSLQADRPGYWVALANLRHADATSVTDMVSGWPWLRKLTEKMIPTPLIHLLLTNKHGIVIRVDHSGRIVESLQDPTGHIPSSAQVTEHEGHLYLSSYFLPFIAKLKLPPVE